MEVTEDILRYVKKTKISKSTDESFLTTTATSIACISKQAYATCSLFCWSTSHILGTSSVASPTFPQGYGKVIDKAFPFGFLPGFFFLSNIYFFFQILSSFSMGGGGYSAPILSWLHH